MNEQTLVALTAKVKLALRVTTTAFDSEITDLIKACFDDLKQVNAIPESRADDNNYPADDALIVRAIVTYCKAYFGENEYAERYIKTYDEIKSQLKTATNYTEWS